MDRNKFDINSQDYKPSDDSMAVMVAPSREPYAISDPFQQHQVQQFPFAYQPLSTHATTSYHYQQPEMYADNGSQGSASPNEYTTLEGTPSDGQATTTNKKNPVKAGRGVPNQSIHEAPQ
jgi:hypothetical protein